MKKNLILGSALSLGLVLSAPILAADEWYVGFGLGSAGYEDNTEKNLDSIAAAHEDVLNQSVYYAEVEQSPSGVFSIYTGQWLTDSQGFEFGYMSITGLEGKGLTKSSGYTLDYDLDASTDVFYGAFMLSNQFENKSRLYGKFGLYHANTTEKLAITVTRLSDGREGSSSDSRSNSNLGLLIGIGYNYEVNEQLGFRVNYDYLPSALDGDLYEGYISALTLSLNYKLD